MKHLNLDQKALLILLLHFLERFLFFFTVPTVPFLLWKNNVLSTEELATFYMVILFLYRGSPVFLAFIVDRIGLKKAVFIGLLLEAIGFLGIFFSGSFIPLILSALFLGAGGGFIPPSVLSKLCYLEEIYSRESGLKLFSWHIFLIYLGAFIAPIWFNYIEMYRIVFIISCIFVFSLVGVLNAKSFPKSLASPQSTDGQNSYLDSLITLFKNKPFIKIWLISVFVWAAYSTIYTVIPAKNLTLFKVDSFNIWLAIDAFSVIAMFGICQYFGFFRQSSINNIVFATSLLAVSLFMIGVTNDKYILMFSVVILGIGSYVIFPQLYSHATKTIPRSQKAQYMGALTVAGAVGEGSIQGIFALSKSSNSVSVGLGGFLVFISVALFFSQKTRVKG